MKCILAVLVALSVRNCVAQEEKPATPSAVLVEPQIIQTGEAEAYGLDNPAPAVNAFARNSFAGLPRPIPLETALIRAAPSGQRPADFKSFQSDRFNRDLVANEFLARGLDAFSTLKKLNNPCRCYREASRLLGVDMTPIFKNEAGAYSYSLGVAAAYSFASATLWNASKNHPHHARLLRRLSRSLLIADISMEMAIDVHNLSLGQSRRLR